MKDIKSGGVQFLKYLSGGGQFLKYLDPSHLGYKGKIWHPQRTNCQPVKAEQRCHNYIDLNLQLHFVSEEVFKGPLGTFP